jgi:hypothetical protein
MNRRGFLGALAALVVAPAARPQAKYIVASGARLVFSGAWPLMPYYVDPGKYLRFRYVPGAWMTRVRGEVI